MFQTILSPFDYVLSRTATKLDALDSGYAYKTLLQKTNFRWKIIVNLVPVVC